MFVKCWRCGTMHALDSICPRCGSGGGNKSSISISINSLIRTTKVIPAIPKAVIQGGIYA